MGNAIKILLTVILILTISIAVFFKDYRIATKSWKYGEGHHVGDFVKFDGRFFKFFNDTLYQNGIPSALLVDYKYRLTDDVLVIESLNHERKGIYFSK